MASSFAVAVAEKEVTRSAAALEQIQIPVTGMTCAACQSFVQRTLTAQAGVKDATVNLMLHNATVTFEPHLITPSGLVEKIRDTGYGAELPVADAAQPAEARLRRHMVTRKAKLSNQNSDQCEIPIAGRKAVGVDPDIKASNLRRLGRIEGQLRGIQRMVEQDRYCPDILMQVTSAQEALRAVARSLMRNHLAHCATHAIQTGSDDVKEAMYDELMDMIYKNAR